MKVAYLPLSPVQVPSHHSNLLLSYSPNAYPMAAWAAYWFPIFQAFTTQCTNPCRDVRSLAFTSLQRSLLSPSLISTEANAWTSIFSKVLFPLIFQLLRPEVFSSDRDSMGELRVQSTSLLCKVFLQYLVLLSAWDGMLDLWLEIVDIMDRLMNSGQGDSLVSRTRRPVQCHSPVFNGLLIRSPPLTGRSCARESQERRPLHVQQWVSGVAG